jgi:hypothetical protein
VVESITHQVIYVNVQEIKHGMVLYVILIVQQVNFIMIHLNLVLVHSVNIGMIIFVFYVMVVKLGILFLKIVNVQQEIYGMDLIVMIHVMEEEF